MTGREAWLAESDASSAPANLRERSFAVVRPAPIVSVP